MNRDFNAVKTFFDPHPVFAGAVIPIPEAVRLVVNELNGKIMSLRNAVAQIQAVTKGKGIAIVNVSENYNFTSLKFIENDGTRHNFRVISFK